MSSWRAQNRAAASALAAIGELFGYRIARCSDTEGWAVDTEAAVSAEVAAALRISQGLAAGQLRADFVRCRDLTCRWPGCDQPVFDCDIDHTVPYADGGPTHASNLKCYCRTHTTTKTFTLRMSCVSLN